MFFTNLSVLQVGQIVTNYGPDLLTSCGNPGNILSVGTTYVVGIGGPCSAYGEWTPYSRYPTEHRQALANGCSNSSTVTPTSATTSVRPTPTSAIISVRPTTTSATTSVRPTPTSATISVRPTPTSATTSVRPTPTSGVDNSGSGAKGIFPLDLMVPMAAIMFMLCFL